jgi:hypothetical protein
MRFQPVCILSPEREKWLDSHVPYRMQILRGLTIYKEQGGLTGPLLPIFPSIFEGALMACRWATHFLGVKLENGSLQHPRQRTHRDVFVFDLGGNLLDPATLLQEERALLTTVLQGANLASAHPTREGSHSMKPEQVDPAAALLRKKLNAHLYDVLAIPVPKWRSGC